MFITWFELLNFILCLFLVLIGYKYFETFWSYKINKPYARKIQILTVGEQRAKVMGKMEVVSIFKKAKQMLKKQHEKKEK